MWRSYKAETPDLIAEPEVRDEGDFDSDEDGWVNEFRKWIETAEKISKPFKGSVQTKKLSSKLWARKVQS